MKILRKGQQNLPGYHQTPQAMSTPITEIPGSTSSIPMTQDSVPLPTPRLPIAHQEERETSTSSSTHSYPPTIAPLFNINRANVGAASSVSSLCHGLKIRVFYFLYIFQTFQMNRISFMVAQVNAVLLIHWFCMRDQVRH